MTSEAGYFLCGKRIGFRWWTDDDFELAKGLWGDPSVTRLFSKEPLSDLQIRERLQAEIKRADEHKMQYWPMFELATGLHIGCGGFRPYRADEQIYELGFHLRPAFWGKGLASEAGKTLIEYGFGQLSAKAIFAGHHPDNLPSQAVLLKLGFEEIGKELYPPTGLLHPSYMLRACPTVR